MYNHIRQCVLAPSKQQLMIRCIRYSTWHAAWPVWFIQVWWVRGIHENHKHLSPKSLTQTLGNNRKFS